MEKITTDNSIYFGWIFLLIFLIILSLLVRQHFIKGINHFKLLKVLYPEQLKSIPSYFSFMMILIVAILDIRTLIWFWSPIYYTKVPKKDICANGLKYHYKLKKSNRLLKTYFFMFFVIMIGGWLFFNKYGE